jgi:pimeloyl-ACP methyl ester carboxylesterase
MALRLCLLIAATIAAGSWLAPSAGAQAPATPEQVAQRLPPPLPSPTPEEAARADLRQGAYAEINGARIFYQVAGTGTPLLLIHGYPLSGQLFQFQLDGLSNQFQVIAPDLRGFGKSEAPNADASTVTYARDMLVLLDQLGIRTAIIGGHSMGGQVALEMYSQAPERFAGMVLIGTNPMAASLVEQGQWRGYRRQGASDGVPSIVPIAGPQLLTGATRAFDSARSTTMMNILAEASLNGVLGGGHALATRPDYTGLLGAIAVPTLVLVGLEDPVYAFPISQMTQMAIPRAALAAVPGASHAVVFERPELANQAIRTWAASP